jgi:hypothetical protein
MGNEATWLEDEVPEQVTITLPSMPTPEPPDENGVTTSWSDECNEDILNAIHKLPIYKEAED